LGRLVTRRCLLHRGRPVFRRRHPPETDGAARESFQQHFLWPVPLAVLAPGGLCGPEVHRSGGRCSASEVRAPTCIAMQTKAAPFPFTCVYQPRPALCRPPTPPRRQSCPTVSRPAARRPN
jgi:hypothetical protein